MCENESEVERCDYKWQGYKSVMLVRVKMYRRGWRQRRDKKEIP